MSEAITGIINGALLKYQPRSILMFILRLQVFITGRRHSKGLKAYMGKDGKVKVFRWEENAKRMLLSAKGVIMAPVPVELFREALFTGCAA
ncbi:MAG: hypothetical protein MZV63_07415 [Marinilabiliales bacterium]|nr:hypothetical protein [Marinilabiliales bacterium]